MACNSSSFEITRPVMSTGSDSVNVFHVFKRIRIGKAQKVRVSLLMDASTGDLVASAAARSANTVEGLDSATPAALTGQCSLSADGESYGQGFVALDTDYQLVDPYDVPRPDPPPSPCPPGDSTCPQHAPLLAPAIISISTCGVSASAQTTREGGETSHGSSAIARFDTTTAWGGP